MPKYRISYKAQNKIPIKNGFLAYSLLGSLSLSSPIDLIILKGFKLHCGTTVIVQGWSDIDIKCYILKASHATPLSFSLAVCLLPSSEPTTAAKNTSINLHFVPLKCEINYIENLLRLIFILAFFIVCFPCTALSDCAFSRAHLIFWKGILRLKFLYIY